ncbi:hypothetical protein JAAARDRAFT_556208 [Jaapia argillacea MUCL 33604]|uniref:Uncharacterized protein n=1 Tax=Jaapia argillacea MUCL 33604 TaxID=933084 RepID=A0A067Q382_9AGAM|nr:hypothetical protein JAAARDRAFT_556208 [Jaapia argillacea MUCL 33604]
MKGHLRREFMSYNSYNRTRTPYPAPLPYFALPRTKQHLLMRPDDERSRDVASAFSTCTH